MELPADYLDLLADELAPFGLEFDSSVLDDEDVWQIQFEAEPETFIHQYPWTDIDASYGSSWPPEALRLRIAVEDGDVVEVSFEIYDVLLWAQSESHELAGRLATLNDPEDQAEALGQALAAILRPNDREFDTLS
ncbi:MAG: hypothetical protein LCH76_12395 [Actinobacteria bacterium]|nr:hypothetical protein [Actinomycetota bacterium]